MSTTTYVFVKKSEEKKKKIKHTSILQLKKKNSFNLELNLNNERGKNNLGKADSLERVCIPNKFVLRFYGPVNSLGSCRVWSVCLTTLFLGRHSPLSVELIPYKAKYNPHFFTPKLQIWDKGVVNTF